VAEDAAPTERAWLGVELPGHRAFVVVGEVVLPAVRTDEEAHQVAALPVLRLAVQALWE